MYRRTMRKVERLLVALAATATLVVAAASSASATPIAVPGEPGCQGQNTAGFAQDWKTFSFEPSGVGPLVRFYGGTNPSDWLQGGRQEDCAAP
jgi:hypothetical protein